MAGCPGLILRRIVMIGKLWIMNLRCSRPKEPNRLSGGLYSARSEIPAGGCAVLRSDNGLMFQSRKFCELSRLPASAGVHDDLDAGMERHH